MKEHTRQEDHIIHKPWPDPVVPDRDWMVHYDFLLARGFALRDHWRPGSSTTLPSSGLKTSLRHIVNLPDSMDAKEVNTGRLVLIRQLQTSSLEMQLLDALSSEDLRGHPHNHCCPILSRFSDPNEPATTFIVIPYPHHSPFLPSFHSINEVMEYGKQLLEGIAFLHSRNIAHVLPISWELHHRFPFSYNHVEMYPDSYDVPEPKYCPDRHNPCRHLSKRPKDVFYFFTHLHFAILQGNTCPPEVSDSDAETLSDTPETSAATLVTAATLVKSDTDPSQLSTAVDEPAIPYSTSDLLPLHENDDSPTPAMINDLQRFVYVFVRQFWEKGWTNKKFAFLQEFEDQVLGPDPLNAKKALALWSTLHQRLSFFQRYVRRP
ncbi:hypothetical protein EIP91_005750 [Steccherinum ochraceum]|uniref:Protein kinase domain-containing protein n=1 Tax=Steccherinum ochraceum TaxID=92696 RepID=A0A4R0RQA0_9APHY|nr:hypothetical protein EIP91_005750 [Steccherinum ochraceum]